MGHGSALGKVRNLDSPFHQVDPRVVTLREGYLSQLGLVTISFMVMSIGLVLLTAGPTIVVCHDRTLITDSVTYSGGAERGPSCSGDMWQQSGWLGCTRDEHAWQSERATLFLSLLLNCWSICAG